MNSVFSSYDKYQEIEKKICSVCNQEKIKILEFPKNSSYCKKCLHEKGKISRKKNRIGKATRGWKDSNWTIWIRK